MEVLQYSCMATLIILQIALMNQFFVNCFLGLSSSLRNLIVVAKSTDNSTLLVFSILGIICYQVSQETSLWYSFFVYLAVVHSIYYVVHASTSHVFVISIFEGQMDNVIFVLIDRQSLFQGCQMISSLVLNTKQSLATDMAREK